MHMNFSGTSKCLNDIFANIHLSARQQWQPRTADLLSGEVITCSTASSPSHYLTAPGSPVSLVLISPRHGAVQSSVTHSPPVPIWIIKRVNVPVKFAYFQWIIHTFQKKLKPDGEWVLGGWTMEAGVRSPAICICFVVASSFWSSRELKRVHTHSGEE